VDSSTFTSHVRPHLIERQFGRRPRFSRAECDELWRQGGPVPSARSGVARPPYVAPPPSARRFEITDEQRESFRASLSPRSRIAFGVATADDVAYVAYLDARKAARAEGRPLPKWDPDRDRPEPAKRPA